MLTVIATLATLSACASDAPKLAVEVHSRNREVVLRTAAVDLPAAGMGILAGLFSPADLRTWPALDRTNPDFGRDVEMFVRSGFLPATSTGRASP